MQKPFTLLFFLIVILQSPTLVADCQDLSDVFRHYQTEYQPIDFQKLYSETTLGVEIEGHIPQSIGKKGMAQAIAKQLKSLAQQAQFNDIDVASIRATESGAYVLFIKGKERYVYVVKDEPNMAKRDGHDRVELNSPVILNTSDVDLFLRLVESLNTLGFTAHAESAGLHVHVGFPVAKGYNSGELAFLVRAYSIFEKELHQVLGVHPSRAAWAEFTSTFVTSTIDSLPKPANNFKIESGNRGSLNLIALLKHGTLEFRLFNATLNVKEIYFLMQFCSRFVNAVRGQYPPLMHYLTTPRDAYHVKDLAAILGLKFENHQILIAEKAFYILEPQRVDQETSQRLPSADTDIKGLMINLI